MITSADEFQIVKNVLASTRGLNNEINWAKVSQILLWGTDHSGSTSSIAKAQELGVDPYSKVWKKAEVEVEE